MVNFLDLINLYVKSNDGNLILFLSLVYIMEEGVVVEFEC